MAKKTEQIERESREQRIKMRELMESGKSEREAFKLAVPEQPNIKRTLELWRNHKLWPMTSEREGRAERQNVSEPIGYKRERDVVSDDSGTVPADSVSDNGSEDIGTVLTVKRNDDEPTTSPNVSESIGTLNKCDEVSEDIGDVPIGSGPEAPIATGLNVSEAIGQHDLSEGIGHVPDTIDAQSLVGTVPTISDAWVTRAEFDRAITVLTDAIKGVEEKMTMTAITTLPTGHIRSDVATDEPPRPPMIGKAYAGERGKIGCTVDKALLDLVNKECEKRHVTLSRFVDHVIWSFFGKPKLSFEQAGAEAQQEEL